MDRRRVLPGAGAVALVAGAVWWSGHRRQTAPVTPDPVALAQASGKPVLVAFGAGHCAACREMTRVLAGAR
ncbi:MAG: hypothetical protein ACK4TJ_12290 [Tabrizicola sp.]